MAMLRWGFTYKTVGFVWVKRTKRNRLHWGMGKWTRSNAELCLIATRGTPKRMSAAVHSVIEAQAAKHSQKPIDAYERIEALLGDQQRIELFARERRVGWDAWGNEAAGSDALGWVWTGTEWCADEMRRSDG